MTPPAYTYTALNKLLLFSQELPNKKLKAGAAVHEGNKEARKYNGKDRMIS